MRITIIGCGNGAFAAAADLTLQGHEITLYANESHRKNFDPIRNNVIKLVNGSDVSDAGIHSITCNT